MEWQQLLCEKRQVPSHSREGDPRNAFEKDYHRILGSASFRRLQDKTQVFPLDKSDFVRTRLTHSLEVSSFAKSLGQMAFSDIISKGFDKSVDTAVKEKACSILECAGLLHDIGIDQRRAYVADDNGIAKGVRRIALDAEQAAQHADQYAGHGADTAGGGDAADRTAGDSFQFIPHSHGSACTAGFCGEQITGQRVHDPGDGVDAGERVDRIDTGHFRSDFIAADGIHIFAVSGVVVHEPEEQSEDDRDNHQVRNIEAAYRADTAGDQAGVYFLETAYRLCIGEHQAETVDNGLRTEGGDEWRNMQAGD